MPAAPAELPSWTGRSLASAARFAARIVPIKGWMLLTERLHPHISDGMTEVVHRTNYGVTLRLDFNDYVQRGIFYGAYESQELNFTRRVLRPGDVMVDVGAHVGIFSLVAARAIGPTGEVHAFEPIAFNYARLAENVELNRLANVHPNQAAVGAESGEISLGLDPQVPVNDSSAWQAGYAVGQASQAVTTPLLSLDEYAASRLRDRPIRFIKVDVEGYEPRVLAGLRQTLAARRVDVLLVEVNLYALTRSGYGIADAVRPLQSAGYRPYRIGPFGTLRAWSQRHEPAITRRPARGGLLRSVRMGLEDRARNFNLVWVREGLQLRR
jgi:FkbM family methyltransferase